MLNIERDRVNGPLTEKTRQKTYITRKHVTGGFFVFGKGKTEGAENSCVGSFGARPVTTRIPGCESWEEALASLREFEEQSLRMDLVSYNSATGIPMDSWDVKTRIWGKPQMGD